MFRFGVDYYPEHWPESRWLEDAHLMAEAGVNVVRLAEFAWSYLEPQPGHFDFTWLDRAIDVLFRQGIQAILGTPTASPAPWVMEMMPGAFRVLESGLTQTYGNRREYCPTHAGYRERGRIITQAMAEHYTHHPAVIGWQIDNELSGYCYCTSCRSNFQIWLQEKYGTLETLNAAWGTIFWSHVYTEWSQIPLPLQTGGVPNPALGLDYRRFMSDAYVHFQQEQVDILRRTCPDQWITHNFMGFRFDELNYFDLAKTLDFVAWDNYPRTGWQLHKEIEPANAALGHDTMRGLKGQPFWLMEEQSGSGGWQTVGMTPRPGEMRLWTYQAIAHGADAIVYFRWRTARFGTEQYWHGVLYHHGQIGRRYEELKTIGSELKRVGEQFLGAENRASVAMILSYDTRWAFQIQPNHNDFKYSAFFSSYYKALHRHNVSVDIVPPTADLSCYRLVVAPALHVLSQEAADNLHRYVQNGGVLLTTSRSGVKDEANMVTDLPLPGRLAEVCGVEVDDYDVLPGDLTVPLELNLPGALKVNGKYWCDVINPTTAQIVAWYKGEYYSGCAAITLNQFGKGKAVYIGTFGDENLHDTMVNWLLNLSGVQQVCATPPGVEAVERWQNERRYLFLLNHSENTQELGIDGHFIDLLSGQKVQKLVTIAPKDVLVLVDQRSILPSV